MVHRSTGETEPEKFFLAGSRKYPYGGANQHNDHTHLHNIPLHLTVHATRCMALLIDNRQIIFFSNNSLKNKWAFVKVFSLNKYCTLDFQNHPVLAETGCKSQAVYESFLGQIFLLGVDQFNLIRCTLFHQF
jgi:hypothetical protein